MKLFGKKDDAPTDAPELDSLDDAEAPAADPGAFGDEPPPEMAGDAPAEEGALTAPVRGPALGAGGNKKKLLMLLALVALVGAGGGGYFYFTMDSGTAPVNPTPPMEAAAPAPAPVAAATAPAPAAQPSTASPPANPLDASNPKDFAGGLPQPAPVPSSPAPAAAPPQVAAAAPAALGPPPGDEASAVAPTPTGTSPASPVGPAISPASTAPVTAPPSTAAATPVPGIEPPVEEPAQDLPMPEGAAVPSAPAPPAAEAAGSAPATTAAATAATAAATTAATGKVAAPDKALPAPAGKGAPSAEPSDAEKAIVQNAAVLDQLSTHAPGQPARPFDPSQPAPDQSDALKTVDQLLEQPAIVRPMPPSWLTVKKEREADDVDTRLTVAREALAQSHNTAALQLFTELKQKYPKDRRILMGRAVALQKLGQSDAALAAYETVLNQDPKNLEALTNMLGLLKKKNPQLALDKLGQLREAYPYNADITAQLGIAYAGMGQYENALKYLDMAEALSPGSANVLYNKAVLFDKMGRVQQACDLYRQIVRMASEGNLDEALPLDAIKNRLAVLR